MLTAKRGCVADVVSFTIEEEQNDRPSRSSPPTWINQSENVSRAYISTGRAIADRGAFSARLGSDSVRSPIGKTFDISNCAISYATKARRHPLILCFRGSGPHWNLVRDLASPFRSGESLEWKMQPGKRHWNCGDWNQYNFGEFNFGCHRFRKCT